ncbi:MAG: SRPBCC domain-containing protein [Nocardioides sp.]
MTSKTATRYAEAAIEAVPDLPIIRITRDFRATPEQLMRAHTDPELFVKWVGPNSVNARIEEWDCRSLGSYRYVAEHEGVDHGFRGTFPQVTDTKIVQTFSYDGMPDAIALETLWFEDLGDGTTRLHTQSLCDSIEGRDGMLSSGMDVGVHEGYAKLDAMLSDGAV